MASGQCLHCLLTAFAIKNRIKRQNRSDAPKMKNGLLQHIKSSPVYNGLSLFRPDTCTRVNNSEPVQAPQHTASDQGLHYLLTGISVQKMTEKAKVFTINPYTPTPSNEVIQIVRIDKAFG